MVERKLVDSMFYPQDVSIPRMGNGRKNAEKVYRSRMYQSPVWGMVDGTTTTVGIGMPVLGVSIPRMGNGSAPNQAEVDQGGRQKVYQSPVWGMVEYLGGRQHVC